MEISLGAAAFWIALASVLIAGGWFKSRSEARKHETLRRIIDKTGQVDAEQMKALFCPPAPPQSWQMPAPKPAPSGKSAAAVLGGIALSIAAGVAVLSMILSTFGDATQRADAVPGFATAGLIGVVGVGLLVVAFFLALADRKRPFK